MPEEHDRFGPRPGRSGIVTTWSLSAGVREPLLRDGLWSRFPVWRKARGARALASKTASVLQRSRVVVSEQAHSLALSRMGSEQLPVTRTLFEDAFRTQTCLAGIPGSENFEGFRPFSSCPSLLSVRHRLTFGNESRRAGLAACFELTSLDLECSPPNESAIMGGMRLIAVAAPLDCSHRPLVLIHPLA